MWQISSNTCWALRVATLLFVVNNSQASASDTNFYQSNTQFGVNLPNASLPSGSDEVRAADGTSCKSAVGGNGSYIDSGVIASPGGNGLGESGAFYSRVVIPLGEPPRRLDCSALYELEVQRLRVELQLAKMGLQGQGQITNSIVSSSQKSSSASGPGLNEAWSTDGLKTKSSVKKAASVKKAGVKSKKVNVAPVADTQPEAQQVIVDSIY